MSIKKEFGNNHKPDITALVYGKVPPQALDLEASVLGAIMLESEKLDTALEILKSEDYFYKDEHQKVFGAIKKMADEGQQVDLLTVTNQLRKDGVLEQIGGAHFLVMLTSDVVSTAHLEAWCRIIVEKYIARQIIVTGGKMVGAGYDDTADVFDSLDYAESELLRLSHANVTKDFVHISKVAKDALDDINEQRNNHSDINGVTTGFSDLDEIISGWQKTDLIIIAARPATGKTGFTTNLAINAAKAGYPVGFFSLEMSARQIMKRAIAAESEIELSGILNPNRLTAKEMEIVTNTTSKIAALPVHFDDTAALSITELKSKAKRMRSKYGIGLIVIDYLQLMKATVAKGGNREQEISKISRDLKALAKELEIPIIALSQLNRDVDKRANPEPVLADLRESGAIEQDADIVIFLYQPVSDDAAKTAADYGLSLDVMRYIKIAKFRNGNTTEVGLHFEKSIQKFRQPIPPKQQSFTPPPSNAAIYQAGRDRMLGESREKINWEDPNF